MEIPSATSPTVLEQLRQHLQQQLIGQDQVIQQMLIALLAGGHVLIEGVPGLGKTLLARTLAQAIGGHFARVQFTPDLMPADITGQMLYDFASSKFRLRKGPVFNNLLLADEINRAPAKTQSALLEVMQEAQVTIEGKSMPVPQPFMVLATQNPLEHEGTYALPEAQRDRFLLQISIDYPSFEDECLVVAQQQQIEARQQQAQALMTIEQLLDWQQRCRAILVDESISAYAVRLVRASRDHSLLENGAGPRAAIALVQCARAQALLQQRDFVLPDDIQSVLLPVLQHRVRLSPEAYMDRVPVAEIIHLLQQETPAP